MSTDARTVLVTVPNADDAEGIVRVLLDERLVACGTIVPNVVSLYRWEGAIERAGEVMVILKTTASAFDAMRHRVVELHPYDVPEVLSLSVDAGHGPYLDWVHQEVSH